ncbi:MAG: C10 family peptidase, partial [Bacteroidaceae bacterium]|nr:C10 family peptidase [Bacteroidaceae bacterium]
TLVYTENDKNAEPAVYVFNAEGNKGYTVVSADDAAVALLGYADEGSFDFENAPENFKAWIAEYAKQVQYARERGYEATTLKAVAPKAAIAPLITARWNQGEPFKNLCPTVSGKVAPTGCVATAMAQVMNYHKYPAQGKGQTQEAWNQQMDFSTVTFDWENMLDVYTSSATETQTTAVATLMKACGYSVNMKYGSSSSGATSYYVMSALVDFFSYDKGAYYYQRDYYLQDEWDELIYDQLVKFGPVYYKGTNTSGTGHAFVCDGYRDGLYHFNWGWGGTSNGYFVLSALDPEVQGIGGSSEGYNYTQAIIGDVSPNQVTVTPKVNAVFQNFYVNQTSTTLGGTFTSDGRVESYTYGGLTGTYYAKMVNVATSQTYYAKGNRSPNNQKVGYGWDNCTFTLPSSMVNGTYKVSPVINVAGKYVDVPVKYKACRYAMMTVSGQNVTIENAGVPKLSATAPELLISKIYKGNYFGMNTTITNNGDSDYNGELYGVLLDEDGYVVDWTLRQVCSFKKGETIDFRYVGIYDLEDCVAETGKTYSFRFGIPSPTGSGYDFISPAIDVEFVDRPSGEGTDYCAYFFNNYNVIDLKLTNANGEEYPKTYLQGEENPKCFRYEVPSMDELYVSFYAY